MAFRTRATPPTPTPSHDAAKTPQAGYLGQDGLFEMDGPVAIEAPDVRHARQRAEAAYNAKAIPRTYYLLARRALEHGDVGRARELVRKASWAREMYRKAMVTA